MFSETEKVNSVPFSPEVEEDRMIFSPLLSLSSVSSVLILCVTL